MDKNPTSSFKIGGILGKKIFRKFSETSVIISSEIANRVFFETRGDGGKEKRGDEGGTILL